MIKKLFLLIFLLLLLIILSPVILLALMYQGDLEGPLPTHAYQENSTPTQVISRELDASLTLLSSPDDDLLFVLTEDTINAIIFAALTQEEGLNPSYQPGSNCQTDACQFLITEKLSDDVTAYLKGIWVELDDDQISIFMSAAVNWQERFTYQTILSLVFNITDDEDAYRLTIDQVRLGRLPVTSRFVGRILGLVERISGQPVVEIDGDLPVGSLDIETFSITLLKSEIVNTIKEDEDLENGDLLGQLLDIFFDNQLLTFKLENQALIFSLRTSLILSDEATVLPTRISELYEGDLNLDLESYLQDRFEEFLLTQALLGETSFRLSQRVFNTIIATSLTADEGLPSFSWDFENSDGIEDSISVEITGVWVTLRESEFIIHALFNIASFPSLIEFTFEAIPSSDPFLLVYEVQSMTMGRSPSDPNQPFLLIDDFDALIPLIRDWVQTDFIRFNTMNQLEIGGQNLETYLNEFLEESGISLAELTVVEGALILELALDPALQLIFDNYANAINDVLKNEDFVNALNTVLDPTNNPEAEDVINQINAISQKLNNNEPITQEDVNNLIQELEDLSTQDQEAFFNAMQGFIDPSLVEEFENSFNN